MANVLVTKLDYQELVKKPRDWILEMAEAIVSQLSLPCSTTCREAARSTPGAQARATPTSPAKQIPVQWLTRSGDCEFDSPEARKSSATG